MFAIRAMRERVGLTQQEVADMLGVKRSRYGDWETERREINFRDAIRLAELLDCSIEELAGREVPDTPVDEARLVLMYRSTDSRGRASIMRTAVGESGVEGQPETGEVAG